MSLILAEVSKDFGWFVGDTLITKGLPSYYPNDKEKNTLINMESHALKIHILSEKLCIAMAGEVRLALKVISEVSKLIESENYPLDSILFDKICSIYKEFCPKDNLSGCDFLIMAIGRHDNILIKIENGAWVQCQKAYIGDNNIYRNLQKKRIFYESLSPVYSPDGSYKLEPTLLTDINKNFIEVAIAMEKVSGRAIDSTVGVIGDNVIRVGINSNKVFAYYGKTYGYISVVNTEVKKRIEAHLLTSLNPKYGIGIYYSEGLLGYIFISGDSIYCRKIEATTLEDFKTKALNFSLEF